MTLILPQYSSAFQAGGGIEVVGASTFVALNNVTRSISWPSGMADGDIAMLFISSDTRIYNNITYTDVDASGQVYGPDTAAPGAVVEFVSYDAARSSQINVNGDSGGDNAIVVIGVRRAAGSTPGTVVGSAALAAMVSQASGTLQNATGSGSSMTPPANTASMSGNALEVHAVFLDDDSTTVSQYPLTGKTPAPEVEAEENTGGGGNDSTVGATCRIRTDTQALNANTGGVTVAQDWTLGLSDAYDCVSFSLEGD